MSLRNRAMLIFASTLFLSAVLAVLISWNLHDQGYERILEIEARQTGDRILALLRDDLEQLGVLVRDWAWWDDSYDFVRDRNTTYMQSNLLPETFDSLGLSAIAILDAENIPLFAFESEAGLAQELSDLPLRIPTGIPADGLSGILRLGKSLHMAVAHRVLRSDGSGPPEGVLIMARPLDRTRWDRYSVLLGVDVSGSEAEEDREDSVTVDSLGKARVVRVLRDIAGRPVGAASGTISSAFYEFESRALTGYAAVLASVFGLVGLVSLFVFDHMVFRSLRSIVSQLAEIEAGRIPDSRILVRHQDEIGTLAGAMNTVLDALNARIREREALLREVNHRVRNNLQIIASLLNLQSLQSAGETANALGEGRRRVQAMSAVYNRINGPSDLSRIPLEGLLSDIADTEKIEGEWPKEVELVLDAPGIFLELDQAVPVSLIAGEFLANALRHAFPGGRAGRIEISAAEDRSGGFSLVVRDDGIGISNPYPTGAGLGLAVAGILASQLGGITAVSGTPGEGTLCRLTVPARHRG